MNRALRFALAVLLSIPAVPAAAQSPPHSWLFGSWTGGLFPAPASISAANCLGTPVLIFTRDVVLRATLIDQFLIQREITTARATPQGFEFRFAASPIPPQTGLLGITNPRPTVGFGCQSPDLLEVRRRGENEITFSECADFPYPLVRCPGR